MMVMAALCAVAAFGAGLFVSGGGVAASGLTPPPRCPAAPGPARDDLIQEES